MTHLILIRALSISLVGLGIFFIERGSLNSFILAFGFSHYFIGWIYSKANFKQVWGQKKKRWSLSLLFGCGGIFSFFHLPPPVLLSPFHHSLSDLYLSQPKVTAAQDFRWLFFIRMLFNISGHFILLHSWSPLLQKIPLSGIKSLFYACSAILLFELVRLGRSSSWRNAGGIALYEGLLFILIFWGNFQKVTILHTILYHSIFWALYPSLGILKKGKIPFMRYVLLTIATTIFFLFLIEPHLKTKDYFHLFIFTGTFHIYLSFALSSLNPQWLVNYFYKSS